jgi:hypothetical protein
LFDLLGWKRAGKWLDQLIGEVDKDEKSNGVIPLPTVISTRIRVDPR